MSRLHFRDTGAIHQDKEEALSPKISERLTDIDWRSIQYQISSAPTPLRMPTLEREVSSGMFRWARRRSS